MQQRRVRLGDILDDYCPRERRITNHAVVAMIDDDVKQTRCTTCHAEHEYKEARLPAARRRKPEGVLNAVDGDSRPELIAPEDTAHEDHEDTADAPIEPAMYAVADEAPAEEMLQAAAAGEDGPGPASGSEDEWPVHRRLIRATLPRPEGQAPERKEPEFTMRQGRFEGNRNGQRHNRGPRRQAQSAWGQFDRGNGNRAPQGGGRGRQGGGGQGGQQRQGGGRKRGR